MARRFGQRNGYGKRTMKFMCHGWRARSAFQAWDLREKCRETLRKRHGDFRSPLMRTRCPGIAPHYRSRGTSSGDSASRTARGLLEDAAYASGTLRNSRLTRETAKVRGIPATLRTCNKRKGSLRRTFGVSGLRASSFADRRARGLPITR